MSVGPVTGKAWTDGQPPPVTAADLLAIEQAIVDAAQGGGGGGGSPVGVAIDPASIAGLPDGTLVGYT